MPSLEPSRDRAPLSPALPRATSVLRGDDFRRVRDRGARLAGEAVVLYALPGDHGVRVGFTAGRRIGTAVSRNRAKRVMREAWRTQADRVGGAFDVVFVARPAVVERKRQDVAAEMADLLSRTGVMR